MESPITFSVCRLSDLAQKEPGGMSCWSGSVFSDPSAFTFGIKSTDDPDTVHEVSLGIRPSQAADFESQLLKALELSGSHNERERSPDGSDDGMCTLTEG